MLYPIRKLFGKHAGQDVFVVGTGTSLTGFDWSRLKGRVTVALNNAVFFFQPTYHFWSDRPIWKRYESHAYGLEVQGVVIQEASAREVNRSPKFVAKDRIYVWTREPDPTRCGRGDERLYISHTVATAALMFAAKLGAKRIFLLGVDAYNTPHATYCDGTRNIGRGAKQRDKDTVVESKHADWIREMEDVRVWFARFPGVSVLNCSEKSLITAWPKIPLDTFESVSLQPAP